MDNTPSFNFPSSEMQSAMPTFVNALVSQGWNYHIAAIPMAVSSSSSSYVYAAPSITNVLVSSSHNTMTTRSGAINEDFVPSPYAVTNPGALQTTFSINQYVGASEQAYRSIRDALQNERANFVRDDAMLIIIVVSNGNDATSGSAATWAQNIRAATGKASLESIQVYPIVSNRYVSDRSCLGANASYGSRYTDLAYEFDTPNPWMYHVCNATAGTMTSMLSALASQLTARRVDYIRTAIVLPSDRRPSRILWVKKNGADVANNDINGWTYEDHGSPRTVCEVTIPFNENCTTGQYVIYLHGSAAGRGDETLEYRAEY
jgi:hypothetical protein